MKFWTLVIVCILLLFLFRIPHTDSYVREPTIREKIAFYSSKWHLPFSYLHAVVSCETAGKFDPNTQSNYHYMFSDARRGIVKGTQERSYGLAQIHLPDNPDWTEEEAKNPDLALDFMAEKLSKKEYWRWYCLDRYTGVVVK